MSDAFFLRPVSEIKSVDFVPLPYMVVKSKLGSPGSAQEDPQTKVFINIVHDAEHPVSPAIDFNPSIVYPLIMNNEWEIPIITTSYVTDVDKQGQMCFVWDCCINSKCIEWCNENDQLKEILVEWCLESCELRSELEIDRNTIRYPKLKYKGKQVRHIEILENDLQNNNQLTNSERPANQEKSSLDEFLEIQAQDRDEEQLIDLKLPGHSHKTSLGSPLIQEITPSEATQKRIQPKQTENESGFQICKYAVTMKKPDNPDNKNYKLKIEISSNMQNCNSLDFQVTYQVSDHSIIVKNLNTHQYKENILQIPLPNFQLYSMEHIKSFFIKADNKLYVII